MVLGNGLAEFVLGEAGREDRGGEKDTVLPDNGAGPAGAGEVLTAGAIVQLGLPEDVLAALGVPFERQVLFVAVTQAGWAAPAGPIGTLGWPVQAPQADKKQCHKKTVVRM